MYKIINYGIDICIVPLLLILTVVSHWYISNEHSVDISKQTLMSLLNLLMHYSTLINKDNMIIGLLNYDTEKFIMK